MKSAILKGFNTLIIDFLDDIATVIPNNEDILTTKVFFENIKKANPTILIKCWVTHVYTPYKDAIDNGDLNYFLNKDYQQDVSVLKNSENIVKAINKIREPIKNMSEQNQQMSMQYIQQLSRLSVAY